MRTLIAYFVSSVILLIGISNAPYLELYPFHYYTDQATLAFFIFGGLGSCFLWRGQDVKSLIQLVMGRRLPNEAAQALLISIEKSWKILAYGCFLLGIIGLVSVLYDVSDTARLGGSLALSILCPLYLLVLRWWVVSPIMQKLKKVQWIEGNA